MLLLPMTPATFNEKVISPALALLPMSMDTPKARVLLIAIALQESELSSRWQILSQGRKGPARGLLQFEQGGGVRGVMRHPASVGFARQICDDRGIPFEPRFVWEALETDDILACAFARLLLFTDQKPLPKLGDSDAALAYYLRCWRPGRPHPGVWPANYARALEVLPVVNL